MSDEDYKEGLKMGFFRALATVCVSYLLFTGLTGKDDSNLPIKVGLEEKVQISSPISPVIKPCETNFTYQDTLYLDKKNN